MIHSGCSSLDGLMEVGPFEFSEEGNLVEREDAWNEYSNILFG
jgi:carboxypeptidase C (cathepsin A)